MNIVVQVIVGILALILAVAFGGVIIGLLGLMLAFFVIVWALGVPISINVGKEKIGYVRWFTFYPK